MSKELYNYKRFAIRASKELHYPLHITEAIRKANTESEIARIMHTAREA